MLSVLVTLDPELRFCSHLSYIWIETRSNEKILFWIHLQISVSDLTLVYWDNLAKILRLNQNCCNFEFFGACIPCTKIYMHDFLLGSSYACAEKLAYSSNNYSENKNLLRHCTIFKNWVIINCYWDNLITPASRNKQIGRVVVFNNYGSVCKPSSILFSSS